MEKMTRREAEDRRELKRHALNPQAKALCALDQITGQLGLIDAQGIRYASLQTHIIGEFVKSAGDPTWTLMITAPRDGTAVLVCRKGWKAARSGQFSAGSWWTNGERLTGEPDYWMPLPEVPNENHSA